MSKANYTSLLILLITFMIACKHDKNANTAEAISTIGEEAKSLSARENDTSVPLIDRVYVNSDALNVSKTKEDFDTIVTYVGTRIFNGQPDDTKMRLFYWDNKVRGYYHPLRVGRDVPVLGLVENGNIALKTRIPDMPEEDGAVITGQIIDDRIILHYRKDGQYPDTCYFDMKIETEKGYPIIFYETKFDTIDVKK